MHGLPALPILLQREPLFLSQSITLSYSQDWQLFWFIMELALCRSPSHNRCFLEEILRALKLNLEFRWVLLLMRLHSIIPVRRVPWEISSAYLTPLPNLVLIIMSFLAGLTYLNSKDTIWVKALSYHLPLDYVTTGSLIWSYRILDSILCIVDLEFQIKTSSTVIWLQ